MYKRRSGCCERYIEFTDDEASVCAKYRDICTIDVTDGCTGVHRQNVLAIYVYYYEEMCGANIICVL